MTLDSSKLLPARDIYGKIKVASGANACVFKINYLGKPSILKCYIEELAFLRDKYAYLSTQQSDYLPKYEYLSNELMLSDARLSSVLLGDWVEGETLAQWIEWATKMDDRDKLNTLAHLFDSLALYMVRQPWAHGDVKPDNIMVTDDGRLVLIDFDAIFCPGLSAEANFHLGTPSFQHPARDVNLFNREMDNYSLVLISLSLHSLCEDSSLYAKYHKGDNIIMEPEEILSGNAIVCNVLRDIYAKNTIFTSMLDYLENQQLPQDNLEELFLSLCTHNE